MRAPGADYDELAARYDSSRGASPSVVAPLLDALAPLAPAWHLLDVGGGTGNYAVGLASAGHHPLVIDRSPAMLARAQGKGLPTVAGEATALPAGTEAADAAVMISMLHQVERWRAAVAEARRVVRPGGWVVLMLYTREHVSRHWLLDYFPGTRGWVLAEHPPLADYLDELPGAAVTPVHFRDTADMSISVLRRYPEKVLDPSSRGQTSYFDRLARDVPAELDAGLARLRGDLQAGRRPPGADGDLPKATRRSSRGPRTAAAARLICRAASSRGGGDEGGRPFGFHLRPGRRCLRPKRRLVHLDSGDPRDAIDIGVTGEQRGSSTSRNGGNHAVDHPPRGNPDAAATAVDARRALEVGGYVAVQQVEPQQQAAQIGLLVVAARPASTSMTTGSVTASGSAAAISAARRRSTALPVALSYSTQADVSARITRPQGVVRRPEARR